MADKSERLTVLSDAEKFALYGLPDFDDRQRLTYLSLSGLELALASSRPGLHAQVWCALQIGYFKAKHGCARQAAACWHSRSECLGMHPCRTALKMILPSFSRSFRAPSAGLSRAVGEAKRGYQRG